MRFESSGSFIGVGWFPDLLNQEPNDHPLPFFPWFVESDAFSFSSELGFESSFMVEDVSRPELCEVGVLKLLVDREFIPLFSSFDSEAYSIKQKYQQRSNKRNVEKNSNIAEINETTEIAVDAIYNSKQPLTK